MQEADLTMANTYETAGETWRVYLGEDAPHPGVLPLIFHCTSNPSHGWRVVEVPEGDLTPPSGVDQLSESQLAELFQRAQPFDFTHDPKSKENTVGDSPLR